MKQRVQVQEGIHCSRGSPNSVGNISAYAWEGARPSCSAMGRFGAAPGFWKRSAGYGHKRRQRINGASYVDKRTRIVCLATLCMRGHFKIIMWNLWGLFKHWLRRRVERNIFLVLFMLHSTVKFHSMLTLYYCKLKWETCFPAENLSLKCYFLWTLTRAVNM